MTRGKPRLWRIVLATSMPVLCGVLVLDAASTSALTGVGTAAAGHSRVSSAPSRAVMFNGTVRAVVYSGNRIYVGGNFTRAHTRAGTVVRRHAAALNARTGRMLGWNPRVDGPVLAIAARRRTVFLGGRFSTVRGAPRQNLARVSAAGRVRRGFVHGPNRQVSAIAIRRHSLYIGGTFGAVNGRDRDRLAAYNLRSRTVRRRWAPSASGGQVRALAVAHDRVYVGGSFGRINGRRDTQSLVAVRIRRGHVDKSFDPSIDYSVHDLAVTRRRVLAAADGTGGNLRAFRLNGHDRWALRADGGVQAVTVLHRRIFFGGHFDNVCRVANRHDGRCRTSLRTRHKLAAVTARRGRLVRWNPDANSKLGVVTMDTRRHPARVAAGGAFTTVRGERRRFFAQFG